MGSSVPQAPIICIHEDRLTHLVGVKLAVVSLLKHCATLPIVVSCPTPPAAFCNWVDSLGSRVSLVSYADLQDLSWNIKPTVLLRLLEAGYSQVIWVDSDIIANGDGLSSLLNYSLDTVVVAQEPYWQEMYWGDRQGVGLRTLAWGLTPKRTLPSVINTGIVRVSDRHIQLLQAWQTMLAHPVYLRVQTLPWYERPLHMVGDQDALTALMGATEFAHIPLVVLQSGVDIAQCFDSTGFTPTERLKSLSTGLPPLIHAMGQKPWTKPAVPPALWGTQEPLLQSLRKYHDYLVLDLSPYRSVAHPYCNVLEDEMEWVKIKSAPGKLIAALIGENPAIQGLPLALVDAMIRHIRRYLRTATPSTNLEFYLKESPLK